MNEGERKGPSLEASGASVGNLLSNVAPPSGLPTFVTSAVPASQLPPSMQPRPSTAHSSVVQSLSHQESSTTAQTFTSADKFSPAIPPNKGEPLVAIRSPEDTQTSQSPVSIAESTLGNEVIGDPMPGSGLLTWVRGAVTAGGPAWLHKVAEKAKSSVDTMITTLDPQMKEYLNSGGDIHIVIASDKEWDVAPVRDAFQTVFGKATVVGMAVDIGDEIAAQAVGAGAAFAGAKHRLATLRANNQQLHNNVPIVAMEPFLFEIPGDKWLEATLLVLSQVSIGVELQVVSQCAPVPAAVLPALQAASRDYKHADTGLAVTAASLIANSLQVATQDWQEELTGVSRRDILSLAARSLAGSYKKMLNLSTGAPPS